MKMRTLAATSAAALLASAGALAAQEAMTSDSMVSVSVDGAMVEVPVSLAAQACGLDEAAVMANASMDMAGTEADMDTAVAPDPTATEEDTMASDDAAAGDAMATEDMAATDDAMATDDAAATDTAEAATDQNGVPLEPDDGGADADASADMTATTDVADAAAETPEADIAEDVAADAGATAETTADTGTEVDASADSATADAAAETLDGAGAMTAVCEIDQATADQFGLPAAGETSGG